jgi:hypothetical protein
MIRSPWWWSPIAGVVMVELCHQLSIRVAGGIELVVTRGELTRDVGELLFQARDPSLACAKIGRRAETAFSPGIVTQYVGELVLQCWRSSS